MNDRGDVHLVCNCPSKLRTTTICAAEGFYLHYEGSGVWRVAATSNYLSDPLIPRTFDPPLPKHYRRSVIATDSANSDHQYGFSFQTMAASGLAISGTRALITLNSTGGIQFFDRNFINPWPPMILDGRTVFCVNPQYDHLLAIDGADEFDVFLWDHATNSYFHVPQPTNCGLSGSSRILDPNPMKPLPWVYVKP